MRIIAGVALLVCTLFSSGCATVVGTVTGAFTNTVDLPRWFLDQNELDSAPEWTGIAVLVFAPLGLVTGPFYGFVKGMYVDIDAGLRGEFDYDEGWGDTYRSVWRPATYLPEQR